MKMIQKMRNARENKKGFTLTEMIVVLVIIVILIALLVPTLVGYIDKAKEKSVMAEGKRVLDATQTIVSEAYGLDSTLPGLTKNTAFYVTGQSSYSAETATDNIGLRVARLSELKNNVTVKITINTENKVSELIINDGGKAAKYDGTKWTLGKDTDTGMSATNPNP
ncbi:prepilin-type N-terminal cleavage/methylation domain-containing protein [Diplocloster hominis]|uniref:prepilin-type N-terminal cleavage/methylation domain-containing protein n=1 Tax=Diplocloster hominis TaxID=3079010 RepID=UPI0031BA8D30